MAKSFNLEVQKKPNSKGMFPVYIRITENRKHKRIKTSVELNKYSDWNPKAKDDKHIRQSELNSAKWNQILVEELESLRDINRESANSSIDTLKQDYKKRDVSESFLEFAKSKVEESRPSLSIGTYRHYLALLNKIESYLEKIGKNDICFVDVNLSFIKGFESYLGQVENQRENGRTLERCTIASNLKSLRRLVNDAVKEDKININDNPFLKFTIKAGDETKKEKLEMAELQKIIELILEKDSALWHTRNAFLFSFYCAGIRAGDILQLRWENVKGGRLNYRMGKNGKIRNYELVTDAEKILDDYRHGNNKDSDYIFPFLDSNSSYAIESYKCNENMSETNKQILFNQISSRNVILNKNLKKIAEMVGIDKNISFHVSRHTFANYAMKQNISPKIIQGLLGHHSIKTTEGYMGNFSNAESDKALEQIFSKNSNNESLFSSLASNDKDTLVSFLKNADKDTLVNLLLSIISK